jgi:ataxia telangiectasia mutated family protein
MEQVFDLVNIMLAQDRETKRRELSLRTYKVIPLPRQTGLLQFIDNTETLSAWLPKAHAK